jgi:hypothetical protein
MRINEDYLYSDCRALDEKFGSALDNPEIFTPEVIDVINDVVRTVDDDAFDDWEPMMLFGGDCLSKVYKIKETSWTSAIQFVAFAGPHPFPAYKKVRGLCSFVDVKDSGKVEPSILLFNTESTSGDEYFEIIIHELKHAYYKFRHPNTKNLEMKYDLLNKPMFIYGENLLNMSPEEVIEKYKTNRDWTSGCIIRNLVYICSKTELTAYAETVNMEIARFAREGKSIDELKRDSKYVAHFLLLAKMFRQIDTDVKSNPEFLKTLDEMCKKWYDKSFKYIWETSRKSLNKQLANIRKSIGMYY